MVIVLETSLQKHLGFVTQLLPKYQFRAQTFGYYHLSAGDLLREDRIFAEIEAFGASMLSPGVSLELSGAQTRRLRVWPAHRELHQGPPSSKTENTGSHHKNCHAKFWHFRICHFFWNKSFSILEKWVLFLPSPENNYRFSCWFLLDNSYFFEVIFLFHHHVPSPTHPTTPSRPESTPLDSPNVSDCLDAGRETCSCGNCGEPFEASHGEAWMVTGEEGERTFINSLLCVVGCCT